jgi:hypothetical protein
VSDIPSDSSNDSDQEEEVTERNTCVYLDEMVKAIPEADAVDQVNPEAKVVEALGNVATSIIDIPAESKIIAEEMKAGSSVAQVIELPAEAEAIAEKLVEIEASMEEVEEMMIKEPAEITAIAEIVEQTATVTVIEEPAEIEEIAERVKKVKATEVQAEVAVEIKPVDPSSTLKEKRKALMREHVWLDVGPDIMRWVMMEKSIVIPKQGDHVRKWKIVY